MRSGGEGWTWGGGLALAGLALLVSSCGSPTDGGSGGVTPAASTAAVSTPVVPSAVTATATSPGAAPVSGLGPCDVLSGAEVAAALGGSGAGGVPTGPHGCVYPGTGGPLRLLVSLVPADESKLAQMRPEFQRLDGPGEWAGWESTTKTLIVFNHGRLLGLVHLGDDLDEATERSVLQRLAGQAVDRW
jgi:hypothetical protein